MTAASDAPAPAPIEATPRLTGRWAEAAALLAGGLAILHLYFPFAPSLSPYVSPVTETLFGFKAIPSEQLRNAIHFGGFALLLAATTPFVANRWARENKPLLWFDLVLGALICVSAIYLSTPAVVADYYDRGTFSSLQWAAGIICVVGALELTRRAAGPIVPGIAILGLLYLTVLGPYAPSPFTFRGISTQTALVAAVYEDEGMFGLLARISSTTIFPFIIFGAFLVRSGAGDFVISLARALAGRLVGGPGLIAVIASGLTGTISGSAVANTASTGVITIPLMKRSGFPPAFAAGVEASASTGGQLMPPIMGAGAFVMASYTNIPYETIIAVSALPALLYFASVAFFVRIEARKNGLTAGDAEGPPLIEAIRQSGASFLIPITLMITLLVVGFSPPYAAVMGVATIIISSYLTRTPMGLRAVWEALVMGGRNMAMMAVLLCAVGLIVNAIVKAGVGNTFSLMIETWSSGNLLIAILLVALASLVLGMGLPVTAAYIVLATLSAPALAGMIGGRVGRFGPGRRRARPRRPGDPHDRRARSGGGARISHAAGRGPRDRRQPALRGPLGAPRSGADARGADGRAAVGAYDRLLAQPGFKCDAACLPGRLHRGDDRRFAAHAHGPDELEDRQGPLCGADPVRLHAAPRRRFPAGAADLALRADRPLWARCGAARLVRTSDQLADAGRRRGGGDRLPLA